MQQLFVVQQRRRRRHNYTSRGRKAKPTRVIHEDVQRVAGLAKQVHESAYTFDAREVKRQRLYRRPGHLSANVVAGRGSLREQRAGTAVLEEGNWSCSLPVATNVVSEHLVIYLPLIWDVCLSKTRPACLDLVIKNSTRVGTAAVHRLQVNYIDLSLRVPVRWLPFGRSCRQAQRVHLFVPTP